MPAAESHRASELVGSILTGMGKWFGIDVPQQNLDYNIRKLAHFLEFAILGVILCNVWQQPLAMNISSCMLRGAAPWLRM